MVAVLAVALGGCSAGAQDRDVLFQTSTISALLEGAYDGQTTVRELKTRGDFGLGTFDALDGEMVVLDGEVYQVRADGRVVVPPDETTTPFAAVTFFDADFSVAVANIADMQELEKVLDEHVPTANLMYAVRVTGQFEYIKVRSVPRQEKPYPRLAEVAKTQPVFEYRNVRGTIVGLRLPEYVKGINMPGYHFHFISEDRSGGGHLLDCRTTSAAAEFDHTFSLHLVLPRQGRSLKADLTGDRQKELHGIEK